MIIKALIPSTGRRGWKYISAVDNFDVEFHNSEDFEQERDKMIKLTNNGVNNLYCWYNEKERRGFVILSIWKYKRNSDQRLIKESMFVITDESVFLLNDNGDTIERLYK